jgi:DNA-binding MarR family transcriptional regulator
LNGYYACPMPQVVAKRANSRRFDSPYQEAFLNLWRTYDRLRVLEDELFGRHDLTAQQYNALRLLKAVGPKKIPTLNLASRLVSRAPDITRLVDKLAERGWVERARPAANRRVVHVGITESGIALLVALDQEVRDCHMRQLGHLRPAEIGELVELLRKVREPHESPESAWR